MHTHQSTWMCLGTILFISACAWGQSPTTELDAEAPPLEEADSGGAAATGSSVAYVKGNNVYIRSGFSTNYYAVTKLNQSDEVRIVDEEFGWLKILPPAGTYSLVDRTYIDRVNDRVGVLNGTTWVYAGSNLDAQQRYAKQVKLDKGDRLRLIGETSDGAFYKIEPPPGAHLWIRADMVDRSGSRPASAGQAASPAAPLIEPVKPGTLDLTGTAPAAARTAPAAAPPPSIVPAQAAAGQQPRRQAPGFDSDRFQLQINAIEAEIEAESAKPLGERAFAPIIARLLPIAEQTDDEISQIYARTRMDQLQGHLELVSAVQEIRDLRETAITNADLIARSRQNLQAEMVRPLDDIVIRGEIFVSGVYDGAGSRPKRWRVVERGKGRTMAYIELPEGSPIDPVQFYGKYVGIRASGYRPLRGSIPPVPIYTVEEIVVLDPGQSGAGGSTMTASPGPRTVAAPESQPASSQE